MDPIKLRMRYLIGFFVAAVLTTAVMRHSFTFKSGLLAKRFAAGF
jgi:hypothetical protein